MTRFGLMYSLHISPSYLTIPKLLVIYTKIQDQSNSNLILLVERDPLPYPTPQTIHKITALCFLNNIIFTIHEPLFALSKRRNFQKLQDMYKNQTKRPSPIPLKSLITYLCLAYMLLVKIAN